MYIPKSQIQIKSTNGEEFEILLTGNPYIGDYIETSQGYRYAGINNFNLGDQLIPIPNESDKESDNTEEIRKFNIIKEDVFNYLINTKPIPSMKKYPSESDYINGFFLRYFSKRINGLGYQEIEYEIFNDIKGQTGTYDYNLYEVGSIKWNLKGNVFKLNALTLKETERSFPNISYLFPKFNEFAREPMQNQENLHTLGGELYYGDGTEYIGAYHIHMTNGPMSGAYHVEIEHSRLYYISELPKPDNMSYEDFLTNYPPPNISPIIPIKLDPIRTSTVSTETPLPIDPPYTGESYDCIMSWGPPPPGYEGLTRDVDGMVVVGSACMDPGNGLGMFNPGEYGSRFVQACYAQCESSFVDDTSGGVGCIMPWDSNYCSTCTVHDQSMCASNYSTSGGQTGGGSSGGMGGGGGGGGYSGGGIGSGNCFVGKTSIIMEDETIKRIDKIKVGDIVKSEINTSNVISIDVHKEKEYTIYSINNSEAFVTAEHPFKTTTGWKAIDPLETFKTHGIESNVLEVGDILITKEGTEEVKSINKSTQTTDTVYNLRLDNEHVYYANGYLVHNNKTGGAWSLDDLEKIQQDYGGSFLEQCPCGVFSGIMQYSSDCC